MISPEIKRGVLWEASKAYMRGQLISFVSSINRTEAAYITELTRLIKDVDNKYASNPDPDLYKERLRLQADFNLASTNKAKLKILKSRQHFFESGDKAGRLLAHQARAAASSRLISAIKSDSGEIHTDPIKINEIFSKFYSDLYTSDRSTVDYNSLNNITFLQIDGEVARGLDAPITVTEVEEAIKTLQSGLTISYKVAWFGRLCRGILQVSL